MAPEKENTVPDAVSQTASDRGKEGVRPRGTRPEGEEVTPRAVVRENGDSGMPQPRGHKPGAGSMSSGATRWRETNAEVNVGPDEREGEELVNAPREAAMQKL